MMRLRMEVAPDGTEPFTVEAGPRDVLQWEKTRRGRSASELGKGISMQAVYEIGHLAVTRRNLWSGTFEEFCASVDVSPLGDDDEPATDDESLDPTSPAASADSSSS